MRWNDLKSRLSFRATGGEGNPEISDVTCDSRSVLPGSLYVSIPGFKRHGDSFIDAAVAQGAVAVVSEIPQPQSPVPWAQAEELRKTLGLISRAVHGIDPSQTLFVGITGTNGKTTTAYLFHHLFSRIYGEKAAWMFGTGKYSM